MNMLCLDSDLRDLFSSNLDEGSLLLLRAEAKQLRKDIVEGLFQTGGGHYGGALSVADILLVLYRGVLRSSRESPKDARRDRCILSKGHAGIALYAVLRRLGYFDHALLSYASFMSPLEGHPDMLTVPGVDFSTGSLGQGLSVGLGMALGLRRAERRVWVILGDGECQEGQVWEAAMMAAQYSTSNLSAIVDCNHHQEWGWPSTISNPLRDPVPDLKRKWAAFGWHVVECDGHNHADLYVAMTTAVSNVVSPTVILANTKKGYGVRMVEQDPTRFHCASVSMAEHSEMIDDIG